MDDKNLDSGSISPLPVRLKRDGKPFKPYSERVGFGKGLTKEKLVASRARSIKRLMDLSTPAKDRVSSDELEDVKWVSHHLGCQGLNEYAAPSLRAWKLWNLYRGSDELGRQFYERFFAGKVLAVAIAKEERSLRVAEGGVVAKEAKLSDERLEALCDRLLKEVLAEG